MHDQPINETEPKDLTLIREGFTVAPPSPKLVAQERSALDDLIGKAATSGVSPLEKRRRRRVRAAVVAGVVGVAALGGGAVAATGVFARTGEKATGGEVGEGELVRIDADDAPAVLNEFGGGIPLPPGGNWDQVKANLPAEATVQADESVRSMLEFNAACQWTTYWLEAESSGDRDAMAAAQSALDGIPNRPDLSLGDERGDTKKMWSDLADSARTGDVTGVRANGYDANCV